MVGGGGGGGGGGRGGRLGVGAKGESKDGFSPLFLFLSALA